MRGYVGANRMNAECIRLGGSSGNAGATKFEGFYVDYALFPTRTSRTKVLMSWHNYANTEFEINTVYSVKMLISDENPKGKLIFNKNANVNDDNPFSDHLDATAIRINATEGQLYGAEINEGKYVVFLFALNVYNFEKGVSEDFFVYSYRDYFSATESNVVSSAPSLNYNEETGKLTIGTAISGRRILEFRNTDHPTGYPTTINNESTLQEMYLTTFVDMENYDNPYQAYFNKFKGEDGNVRTLDRWEKGSYSVLIRYVSQSENDARIQSAIENAVEIINDVMSEFGIRFVINNIANADVVFWVGKGEELFTQPDYNGDGVPDYFYGGQWETSYALGKRLADIYLANDYYDYAPFMPFETVALEELLQTMGAGWDQVEYPYDTMHTQVNYYHKCRDANGVLYITEKDREILRLLYSDEVNIGMNCTEAALALNIPQGCYFPSDNTSNVPLEVSAAAFLKKGSNYKVRAFIVKQSGELSEASPWINVYVTATGDLEYWYWSTPISPSSIVPFDGAFHPVTAEEWNNFCDRLNTLGEGSFSEVRKGQDFSPEIYNEVATALRKISSPYGIKYAIDNINENTVLCAALFTNLQDQFNYIVDCMS
jgi:hypothetical protein